MSEVDQTYRCFIAALWFMRNKHGSGFNKELHNKTKISSSFLSQIFSGKKKASFEHQVKLAMASNFRYESFLKIGRNLLTFYEDNEEERLYEDNIEQFINEIKTFAEKPDSEIYSYLEKARDVLKSHSLYSKSLKLNIESSHVGVLTERNLAAMERRKENHPEKIPGNVDRRKYAGK